MKYTPQESKKFVPITNCQAAKAEAAKDAHDADEQSLIEKHRHDLRAGSAEGLEHSYLAGLLHHEGNLRAHDAERRHDHDEKEEVKHDVLFHDQCVEHHSVVIEPCININIATDGFA